MARSGEAAASARRRQWRQVVRRFERSGLSVAQFCEAESISAWSLYDWRRKLGGAGRVRREVDADDAGFVELGVVPAPNSAPASAAPPSIEFAAGLELRIDLGGGLVLQISRR
jgi:hypothetical protein